MFKRFVMPKVSQEKTIKLDEISAEGRARLLDMAYSRLRFGIAAMPFIAALFAWYYCFENHPASDYRVMLWAAIYFVGFGLSSFQYKNYKQDQERLSASVLLEKWLPKIQWTAVAHGFAIAALLPIVSHTASIEFKYLYVLTASAIIAGNATHQSPMLSIFHRFLAACWHVTVILMPWTIASHWQFIMPLSAIYSVGMYKYSLTSHRFFVRMIWLEEEGARLAESYKLAKEQVEVALSEKNQFLTTASHDLRQPISAMGFLIESIVRRNADVTLTPALTNLKRSVHSITQMFNSLLDLSKIESGEVKIHLEAIALDALIEDICAVFREEAQSRNLELRVRSTQGKAIVLADTMLLRQSILNLIQNALRYTKQGGVLIAARARGNSWQIEVWDTGIGVAIQEQDHVYSPFYRNAHAWHIDNSGHGLGLAVVARCATLMAAKYGLTSREGRGSRFWLRLPATTLDSMYESYSNYSEKFESTQQKEALSGRCLIVDDDPEVRIAWESLLESWGLQVKCAASALPAFEILASGFLPNAIFCDQRLRSGESGFDVLRELLERCPNASGAMISGEFNSPELLAASNEGYIVLHKPLEPQTLYTLLSRWLNSTE